MIDFLHQKCSLFCFYNTLLCWPTLSTLSSPALRGWPPSVFQATAPVSIPVCPELAGLGSDNGVSVSWQSPPVIFKGASVSDALHHGPHLLIPQQPSRSHFTFLNPNFT